MTVSHQKNRSCFASFVSATLNENGHIVLAVDTQSSNGGSTIQLNFTQVEAKTVCDALLKVQGIVDTQEFTSLKYQLPHSCEFAELIQPEVKRPVGYTDEETTAQIVVLIAERFNELMTKIGAENSVHCSAVPVSIDPPIHDERDC